MTEPLTYQLEAIDKQTLDLLKTTEHFRLLYEVFDHYLTLIKSRSQAFEDGHITVYDKALLHLSRNGNDLHNVGALELYLDEVVGVSRGQHVENLDKLLNKHVALKTLLLHSMLYSLFLLQRSVNSTDFFHPKSPVPNPKRAPLLKVTVATPGTPNPSQPLSITRKSTTLPKAVFPASWSHL